jgi:hypothetical protein
MQPRHDDSASAPPTDVSDDWPRPHRTPQQTTALGILALLAAGALAGLVTSTAAANSTGIVIFGGATVYFGIATGAMLSQVRRPRGNPSPPKLGADDQGDPGLMYSYAWMPVVWLCAIVTMTALVLAVVAIAIAAGGTSAGWVTATPAGIGAFFLLWFAVALLRRAPGRVVLTPTGVYHRSLTSESYTPWDVIYDVGVSSQLPLIVIRAYPSPSARHRARARRPNRFEEAFRPSIVIGVPALGANARPVLRSLEHYLRHPENRNRLNTTDTC